MRVRAVVVSGLLAVLLMAPAAWAENWKKTDREEIAVDDEDVKLIVYGRKSDD